MSGHLLNCLILLSTLASAQLATFPKRLRRGSAALNVEEGNELQVVANFKGEFGRARQLDSFSMSMTITSISLSLDLEPAAMEFDIKDGTSMATVAPTYYPSYVPTEKVRKVVSFMLKEALRNLLMVVLYMVMSFFRK